MTLSALINMQRGLPQVFIIISTRFDLSVWLTGVIDMLQL